MNARDALNKLKESLEHQPGCATIYASEEAVRALVEAYETATGLAKLMPVVGGTKVFTLRGGAGLLIHGGDDVPWETVHVPELPDGCSAEYAAEHFRRIARDVEAHAGLARRSNINGRPLPDADRGDPVPHKE